MSRRALLLAVRDTIRTDLGYDEASCKLTAPNGQPPAGWGGHYFVGVWSQSRTRRGEAISAIDTDYDVVVTLTARMANVPFDKLGDWLANENSGVYDKIELIADVVNKDRYNFLVCNRANAILGDDLSGNEPTGFREGLYFERDSIRLVDGTWFHADPKSKECGVVADIRFGKARRLKNLVNTNVGEGNL